ncbi:MAG: hypothetical protein MUC92_00300 [Fimbriimonadaceae bacterium]|nr:hypothetical protein [Fimbriimonadaceae bacterium]
MKEQRERWGLHGIVHGGSILTLVSCRYQVVEFSNREALWTYEFASALILNGLWWGLWGGVAGYFLGLALWAFVCQVFSLAGWSHG